MGNMVRIKNNNKTKCQISSHMLLIYEIHILAHTGIREQRETY